MSESPVHRHRQPLQEVDIHVFLPDTEPSPSWPL